MPRASWIRAVAACAALTTIVGCGPARTTSPDIALTVNAESSPGQPDVTLIGVSSVCDGQLDIDASVDVEQRVGAHPIPLDVLATVGCVTPVESALGDDGGLWELTCNSDDSGNGGTRTLHVTGSAEHNGSDSGRPTWFWGYGTFTVSVS